MRKILLTTCLIALLQQTALAHDSEWGGYSLDAGSRSIGFSYDYYNDFFPAFIGLGAHKFHSEKNIDPSNAINGHVGFGFYYLYVTIGLAYASDSKSGSFVTPSSVGGSYPIGNGQHFAIGPYVNYWSYDKSTKNEVGLKFTYSPAGLRP